MEFTQVQGMLKISVHGMGLESINLILQLHLPGPAFQIYQLHRFRIDIWSEYTMERLFSGKMFYL